MNRLYPLVLEHRLPTAIRYGISCCVMVVCALFQLALQMQTGWPGYFLLLPGVFVSGLVFDRGSGVLAAVIAVSAGAYLSYAGAVGLDFLTANVLFAITAAGTAAVAEFQRAELRRVMLADKTKALLLQEMAHRTKNNLAILGGMIRLEARHGGPEVAAALQATSRRVQVMAEVYDHLAIKEESRSVDMRYFLNDVVEKVFQSLAPSGPVAFKVLCENFSLPHNQALAVGIIVNELVTNALKYAFPDQKAGYVTVELSKNEGLNLAVSDNGIGFDETTESVGLGSTIVQLLTQQLEAELTYQRLDPGLRVMVRARSGLGGSH
ncbi:sensor histidine kinase [Bradyrhizobium stylosanthis]|uniref:histidine kinase n=1 Tax=Bradyrhizobium stylosanthis TaxID=1803665 RepID=A0A560E2I2_9BRAD|nr:sensor histidine kinase [Bradyrhizobium stylosanthis]TWB03591.1 two-component sensor histidine kinase [Bradyrhizobium stylosanthis]